MSAAGPAGSVMVDSSSVILRILEDRRSGLKFTKLSRSATARAASCKRGSVIVGLKWGGGGCGGGGGEDATT